MMSLKKSMLMVPIPGCINYMWNMGSLLGMNLLIQIVSGLLLALNFEASSMESFESVIHISQDVLGGWMTRYIHANGASFFFILMYLHIARGIYYGGYKNIHTWMLGISILLISMGTAFLGYVLPWGQMSLWGATVITNLVSAIPYVGNTLTIWIWGGFSVGSPTLMRFFSLHFVMPFIILLLVMMHMLALHMKGSSNPLGLSEQADKLGFHPYFTYKDALGGVVMLSFLALVVLLFPDVFMDPDNYVLANSLVTPPHIQPEWYFLFAYAILRSIPSKLGGVVGLVMSIMVFYFSGMKYSSGSRFNFLEKWLVISIFTIFLLLTWAGAMPASYPFVTISKVLSSMYFLAIMLWLLF